MSASLTDVPTVLFVCVQNAGRSQMAEALFNRVAADRAASRSAGTRPASELHPEVVTVLQEIGVDTSRLYPKALTQDIAEGVDLVVTMGCGDECPVIPGARVVDWDLTDPAGKPLAQVRAIRDEITERVAVLLRELLPP